MTGNGGSGYHLATRQCLLTRSAQALGDVIVQIDLGFAQPGGDAAGEDFGVGNLLGGVWAVHSTIPLALSTLLKVWMARKQWVFTLPSEQPMAAAVSAMSISSQ
ncbi:hypothetical protein D3C72_1769290 [compost metagenome]